VRAAVLLAATPLVAVTVHTTLRSPTSMAAGVYVYVAELVPTATPPSVHAYVVTVLPAAGVAVNVTVDPPTTATDDVGEIVTPRTTVRVAAEDLTVPRA
jgi:hypothetical protein